MSSGDGGFWFVAVRMTMPRNSQDYPMVRTGAMFEKNSIDMATGKYPRSSGNC